MKIRIDGKVFTVDPDLRFSHERDVPRGTWNELWRRYELLNYHPYELLEYLHLKTGKRMHPTTMQRWIFRTKIYYKVNHLTKSGAKYVNTEVFGELENELVKELTRQMKASATLTSRIIL